MDRSYFDGVWEKMHARAANILTQEHTELAFYETKKQAVYSKYEELKAKLKKEMQGGIDSTLDRHKVAALLAQATIIEKPLHYSKPASPDADVCIGAMLANERMALHVAISVVSSFIIADAEKKDDKATINIFSAGINLPACQHDSYELHLAKALYNSSNQGVFDYFFFANILFLIEAYSKQINSVTIQHPHPHSHA